MAILTNNIGILINCYSICNNYLGWKINFIHIIILLIAVGYFSLTWLYWNFQGT